jgi:hypothetical protein
MGKQKPFDLEKASEMYASGLSTPDVAKAMGVSPATAQRRLRGSGVVMRSCSEAAAASFANGRSPPRFWLGKKQPAEMVLKRAKKTTGPGNGRWIDGRSVREYRKLVEKYECEKCGTRIKLVIHHINADHYDNTDGNLSVLCESCHNALHVMARHARNRGEKTIPKSNTPCGWNRVK